MVQSLYDRVKIVLKKFNISLLKLRLIFDDLEQSCRGRCKIVTNFFIKFLGWNSGIKLNCIMLFVILMFKLIYINAQSIFN